MSQNLKLQYKQLELLKFYVKNKNRKGWRLSICKTEDYNKIQKFLTSTNWHIG